MSKWSGGDTRGGERGSKAMRGLGAREFFHRTILVVGKVLPGGCGIQEETTGATRLGRCHLGDR